MSEDARDIAQRIVREVLDAHRTEPTGTDPLDGAAGTVDAAVSPTTHADATATPDAMAAARDDDPARRAARRIVAEVLAAHAEATRPPVGDDHPAVAEAEQAGPASASPVLQPVPGRPAVVPAVPPAPVVEAETDTAEDASAIARRIVASVLAQQPTDVVTRARPAAPDPLPDPLPGPVDEVRAVQESPRPSADTPSADTPSVDTPSTGLVARTRETPALEPLEDLFTSRAPMSADAAGPSATAPAGTAADVAEPAADVAEPAAAAVAHGSQALGVARRRRDRKRASDARREREVAPAGEPEVPSGSDPVEVPPVAPASALADEWPEPAAPSGGVLPPAVARGSQALGVARRRRDRKRARDARREREVAPAGEPEVPSGSDPVEVPPVVPASALADEWPEPAAPSGGVLPPAVVHGSQALGVAPSSASEAATVPGDRRSDGSGQTRTPPAEEAPLVATTRDAGPTASPAPETPETAELADPHAPVTPHGSLALGVAPRAEWDPPLAPPTSAPPTSAPATEKPATEKPATDEPGAGTTEPEPAVAEPEPEPVPVAPRRAPLEAVVAVPSATEDAPSPADASDDAPDRRPGTASPMTEDTTGGLAAVDVDPDDEPVFGIPVTGPPRRTGRWLLTSILGAVALAVLLPMAIAALRDLVALS
ncbi:hypothetical protein [Egicoccus halophilus]|uniref:Uncharacterized protein n=1 Tax=Egicoccus halophilus TaxID=1670830 RepID=A0A8J3EVL0_9ACTN|nr:hypothetical protein [Egicoccus halophilus]GGI08344.1 hypothetical protein GCM10011354_28620 [Egicoccus halophilus]